MRPFRYVEQKHLSKQLQDAYNARIARNVRDCRIRQGLSVPQLARSLHCTTAWIYMIESGKRPVTTRTLAQLAEIFGVDPAMLSEPL